MQENIKQVIVKNTVRKEFKTAPIFQWDTGHVLVFEGFDLPEAFQVHFAFSESGESVTQIGSNDQVTVPDALVEDGRMIYAWLYISTEDAGLTKFVILMPVNRRAKPTHQVPPPVEQSEIDQAIAALNTGVARAETAADNAETAEENASQYAENAYHSSEAAASSAESAEGDARTATQKAQEALTAALDADRKAQNASESAQLASQKASEASGYADGLAEAVRTANEAKQTAVNKATEATQSASNAAQKAQEALSSAQAAEGSANDADTAKQGAESARDAAQGYAGNASMMAQEATQSKNTAVEKAGEASQSADNAAQSAQAAQQTAQQFEQDITDLKSDIQANQEGLDELSDTFDEHEEYAENTYAKQDGYYSDLTAGNAEQLVSSKLTEDQVPYKLRPAGGTNDIGNREYKEAIVGGTIAWNQLVRDEASENVTDFADVVTVTDAVADAAGVKVKLEPVQDLHGYDHPWPAGGGKNLIVPIDRSFTNNGVPCVCSASSETVSLKGTATNSGGRTGKTTKDIVLPAGTYTLSITAVSGTRQATYIVNRTDNNSYISTATFSLAEETSVYVGANVINGTVYDEVVRIQIEAGSTASDWTPYSNICPITGWDGVQVSRTGKNLFGDYTVVNAYIPQSGKLANSSGDRCYIIPIMPSMTYAYNIVRTALTQDSDDIQIGEYYGNERPVVGSIGTRLAIQTYSSNIVSGVFTTSSNAKWIAIKIGSVSKTDIEATISTAQVEIGSVVTAYEPYAGQTYDITLPTEAGTVYGGELTVNADGSGSLVVDRKGVVYDGSNDEAWGGLVNLPWRYSVIVDDIKRGDAVSFYVTSNLMKTTTNHWSDANYGILNNMNSIVVGYPPANNDVAAFRAFLSSNPLQVVYLLATPITYTLTPTEIRTLLGQNNIWADTGDLALTYTGTDEHLALESGKKYLARLSGTDSMLLGSGQEITAAKGTDNVFDLTKMFGTAVADYVYGQGASFFRRWFGKQWYPYNAGELKHVEGLSAHEMVGFNQWDGEYESGYWDTITGQKMPTTAGWTRSKNYIPVLPNTTYCFTATQSSSGSFGALICLDSEHKVLSTLSTADVMFTTPNDATYVVFYARDKWFENPICISFVHNGSRNGEYEPYEKHSYPLDSTVVLRGIPKVDSNGVYWDGDRYLPDGTVERRYGVVEMGQFRWVEYSGYPGLFYINVTDIPFKVPASNTVIANAVMIGYQSFISRDIGKTGYTKGYFALAANRIYVADDTYTGNVSEFKAAMQGVLLVYELATPTTETAQPYHSTQWVSDCGTEEFVTTGLVPVGHETQYPANLRDKLQHLPDLASSNGIYIVKQTDSEMELLKLPDMPTANGNYRLKLNVASGSPTFSWEVVT